jgi:L-lactate dehydrogenase complex protein LldG
VVGADARRDAVSARDDVLRRVRAAIGGADPPAVPRAYRRVGDLAPAEVVARFVDRVDDYRATVHRCGPDEVAATAARVLASAGSVVVPRGIPDGWVTALDPLVVVRDDGELTAAELDRIGAVLTGCAVAIAETGTIILDAGADQGRRAITLVPDRHVCVVAADRIVETVPEGLARVDGRRPLTLVSGPSATSDIELDRVEGVHGPRRLDVVVVGR